MGDGASTRLISNNDVSVRGELTTISGAGAGHPLEWWGAWVGVLVKARVRWAAEVVVAWQQLVQTSKAVLIRYTSSCVRTGRQLLCFWLEAARECSRRRTRGKEASMVLAVVKLNLACGTWLAWHARQLGFKRVLDRVHARIAALVLKWWLLIAQISAGQTELRTRSLQRLVGQCLSDWWGFCQARSTKLALCYEGYLATFVEGQTLLVRPALFTWMRYASTQLVVRRQRRCTSRRLAVKSARAWRSAAAALVRQSQDVKASLVRRSWRQARRTWQGWLAVLRLSQAVMQVCKAVERKRRKRWVRAWCLCALRRLGLRDGARTLASIALHGGQQLQRKAPVAVGGDSIEDRHMLSQGCVLTTQGAAPGTLRLDTASVFPRPCALGSTLNVESAEQRGERLRFDCFRACMWIAGGGGGGICRALDVEGEMSWVLQRRGRRAKGLGGLGSYMRFESIISWILRCPARPSLHAPSNLDFAGKNSVEACVEPDREGGNDAPEAHLDGMTRRLTRALTKVGAHEHEHGAWDASNGQAPTGDAERARGDGDSESKAVAGGRGRRGEGFPLIGPLARWDVRGGWGLSIWGVRYGLVVLGIVLGRWRACVRVAVVGRELALQARRLGRRCQVSCALPGRTLCSE